MNVAAYCRVSTEKSDQIHSFLSQQSFFREYVAQQPDWKLYRIYADEGITGTSTKGRREFQQMMSDAHAGKFQRILTREVSRFSRNLLDTIYFSRELKRCGVGILFLSDGIDTMDPDAELRLSIMASIAQEESRRTSQRVTWGQTRQMEKGVVFGRSLLGYRLENGILSIVPEEAEIVKQIFCMYTVERLSTYQIAAVLTKLGCHTHRGTTQWSPGSVLKILKNEKYAGDLVQKKTFTPDYLTHEKRINRGEVPLIIIKDHHEAIIGRSQWDRAQTILQQNNRHRATESPKSTMHLFSGKIRCGLCGAFFTACYRYRKDGSKIRRWSCPSGCGIGKLLNDSDAYDMVLTALASLPERRETKEFQRLLSNDHASFVFLREVLKDITVYKDRHMELQFHGLDHVFSFM